MNNNSQGTNREQWSSKIGFIMSAAGSAIGLGNLWKFPYMAGTNGGGIFLLLYILLAALIGIPILMTELAVGRAGRKNAIASCRSINPHWGFVGAFGIAGAFFVLSYYCVVGGWVLKYLASSLTGSIPSPGYFDSYSTEAIEPIIWMIVFCLINVIIVSWGVSKGIERVSTIVLPLLLIMLLGIMVYVLTLPNAIEGVSFIFLPNFSDINSIGDFAKICVSALGQVFFSLSLGMGTLITYGSYLDKNDNLGKSTVTIVAIDTIIAIISSLTVMPAVFSFGLSPDAGTGLVFSTLPAVFANLKGGKIISAVFFLLVLFAAVTSSISLLEVIAAFLSERFSLSRKVSVILPTVLIAAVGTLASLSCGILSDVKIMGMTFFDFFVFLSDQVVMPLGGFFLCILAGYIWDKALLKRELTSSGKYKFRLWGTFRVILRYIAPVLILVIFISLLTS